MWTPLTKDLPEQVVLAFDAHSIGTKHPLCITKACNDLPAAIHDGYDGSMKATIDSDARQRVTDAEMALATALKQGGGARERDVLAQAKADLTNLKKLRDRKKLTCVLC